MSDTVQASKTRSAAELGTPRGWAQVIGALISALNDRNITAAIRVLEADGAPRDAVSTRVRCIGCGE